MKVNELPLILGLNISGMPMWWVDYESAAIYYAKNMVLWSLSSDFRLTGGIQRSTGLQSILDISTIIAIKGRTNSKNSYLTPGLTNKGLFRRDNNICAYCFKEFFVNSLTRDHVIPKIQNGWDVWENVVTSCKSCNMKKGGRRPEQVGMKLIYIPYAPCQSEHLILMNRRILTDQMAYLKQNIKNKYSRII